MHVTEMVPNVPLASFKRTKIIATIGPVTDTYETVYQLIDAGVNGIRLNFSHGTQEEHQKRIPWARKAGELLGKPVAIIQDLQGPKVRLGDFDGEIQIETGEELRFALRADYAKTGIIPTQYDLSKKMKKGERLYLFDGKVRATITDIQGDVVHATAENNGYILKRKGMNLPDTDFGGDILTAKDLSDMKFGATQDIDYVAISFIQSAADVENVRRILQELGSDAKIISKIETKAAVDNIESIVQASDAVMVARGDLAVETPAESVPVVQRQIVTLGQKYAKPTIVATQMLLSMTDMPEPMRAEVSDVATAVFMGADCVMLSDETANGKYPVEAVKTMKRVVLYAEQHPPLKTIYPDQREQNMQNVIATSVVNMAHSIEARAIVAETRSGVTALQIACRRPETALIAVTSELRTAQQLAIAYDIKSYVRPNDPEAGMKLTDWLRKNNVLAQGDTVVMVTGRYPGVVGKTDTIKVRVLE